MHRDDPYFLATLPCLEGRLGQIDQVQRIGQSQSVTFQLESAGAKYLLRVHAPLNPGEDLGFETRAAIESECMWLLALFKETKLHVARPIIGSEGTFVSPVVLKDSTPSWASLLTWVEGEMLEGKRTSEQSIALANLMAGLHAHARSWQPPIQFQRPTHTRAWTRTALGRIQAMVEEGWVQPEDQARLLEAFSMFSDELAAHETNPENQGLIHGDLHSENYVEHQGRLAPIDFGRSGYGPWLYDIAECIAYLLPDRRGVFLKAYARHLELPESAERLIEGYFVQAVIETMGYNAPNELGREGLCKWIASFVKKHCACYLAGKPFLREI